MKTEFSFRREYFLLLLPLFFVFHGLVENRGLVHLDEAAGLLIFYIVLMGILSLVLAFFFRSFRKAALMVSVLMGIYFFFGGIHDGLKTLAPGSFIVKYVVLLPLLAGVAIFSLIALKKSGRKFERLTRYLNVLFLVLVLVDAVPAVLHLMNAPKKPSGLPAGFTSCEDCPKPDIYLIIADEYAGKEQLKEILGFDNTPFLQELERRGFHVVKKSASNYNWSPYSVASFLSMDYLQGITWKPGSRENLKIAYPAINENNTLQFLSSMGYEIKNLSFFEVAGQLPITRETILPRGTSLITSQTLLGRINRDIRFNMVTRFRLKSEIRRFAEGDLLNNSLLMEKLKDAAADTAANAPRFIYTHLLMPHFPYYFDSAGKARPFEQITESDNANQDLYLGYLKYGNRRYLELIDHILAHSKNQPVILLMGDHGYRHFIGNDTTRHFHFNNLNAVLLPGRPYAGFYEGISLVNQLRQVFNAGFGQRLPLLKDSAIFLKE